jgi:glycosyltransferase involved in cell wall biosynthesis
MAAPICVDTMRLVFVAPFARSPKGTTRARVFPLARALAELGHQVTVLVPPYDNPQESGQRYRIGRAAVEALTVGSVPEQSPMQAIVQPRLAWDIVRRALSLGPDVVHVFKPKAVSGLTQLLVWYGRKLGVIRGGERGAHGYLPSSAAAGQRDIAQRSRRGSGPVLVLDTDDWEGHGGWNEYEAYPWWQKELCDWQERWGLTHADAVTAASRTLEAQAWSHRVGPKRVIYLPNGLAPEDYPGWEAATGLTGRARFGLGGEALLLLYTRFFEFDPERIVTVLQRVTRTRPKVKLLVVGAGKYGQEHVLLKRARERGMASNVVLAGWQSPESLPDLLMAGDVALFPSDDNLANRAKCSAKLLEALWLRRPVVADRVGQLTEYVDHNTTGLLSHPEDPDSMADAALRLLADQTLAARLGQAGRERVLQEFNWPSLARQAERAYRAALD